MVGPADYHMHTSLCHHAEGHLREYVKVAAESGLTEMGFACHSPMREDFDDWRMSIGDLPRYLEMVAEAQDYGSTCGVTVRLGLEVDYLPGQDKWIEELSEMASWDYFIGSVHYLTDTLVVDHPDHLSQVHAAFTPEQVWERYWKLYVQAIRTGYFDIMAHPDLPKKFGTVPRGDLSHYYRPAIQALKESNTAYEINTAGLRKPIQAMYPAAEFVQLGAQEGILLVISSDAHAPAEVGADFDQAITLAKHAGYEQLAHFEKRSRYLLDF
ncbi:MAG: histidinol-phosphatase HisJ family protein [Verrucomicrobiales bacterium]|jgi:histidinol-phosphatase (PHP family)